MENEYDDNIYKLLTKYFDKRYKGKQKAILEEQIDSISIEIKKFDYCKKIFKKLNESPFKSYVIHDEISIRIYAHLFDILKNKVKVEYDIKEPIYFDIIHSLYTILKLENLNAFKILIQTLKDENIFILKNFSKLINELIIPLLSEKDITLRNNGFYLDQIIKDEIGSLFQNGDNDDIIELQKEMKIFKNNICDYLLTKLQETDILPQTKILVISWFYFLESLPGQDLNEKYKDIIINILNIINSNNKEVSNMGEIYVKKIIDMIIYQNEQNEQNDEYKFNLVFFREILKSIIDIKNINNNNEQYKSVLFYILKKFLEKFNKILKEKKNIKTLRKKIPFELFHNILKFILLNIINFDIGNQINNDIENQILELNTIFSNSVKRVKPTYFTNNEFKNIINDILLRNLDEKSTNIVFDWIIQLYNLFEKKEKNDKKEKNKEKKEKEEKEEKEENIKFLKDLFLNMKDLKDFHIRRIIGIMKMIKNNNPDYNKPIIEIILEKFKDKQFTEEFGFFIFNELSDESNETINIIEIYREIAEKLKDYKDIDFIKNIIDLLTKYLTKEEKAKKVIDKLKEDETFFKAIYEVFCYNPFDTLVFLLITKSFELSYFFVLNLSKMDFESSDLIELSKAVQIFESNFFIDVRIQLLNPKSNIYLIKTLYAILLLLPPGPALKNLNNRLKCLEILFNFDDEEQNNDYKIIDNIKNNSSMNISEIKENDSSKLISEIHISSEHEKNIDGQNLKKIAVEDYINIFNDLYATRKDINE